MGRARILIANDDGIASPGIIRLAREARNLGEVWVVAPESQRSAASHSLTYFGPVTMRACDFPVDGVHAFACSGTPADCVRIALLALMPKMPDFVLSGINDHYNVAYDLPYSGTLGAAMEAAFHGVHAVALSQGSSEKMEVVDAYLHQTLEICLSDRPGPNQVWNVNFPACEPDECKGILCGRTLSQDAFYDDTYRQETVGEGVWTFTVEPGRVWNATEGTDLAAVIDNYVSIGLVSDIA